EPRPWRSRLPLVRDRQGLEELAAGGVHRRTLPSCRGARLLQGHEGAHRVRWLRPGPPVRPLGPPGARAGRRGRQEDRRLRPTRASDGAGAHVQDVRAHLHRSRSHRRVHAMTHSELIAEVAKDAKLPRAVVAGVLRSFIKVIIPTLMSGASVRLRMFGTFYTVVQKKRPLFGGKKET